MKTTLEVYTVNVSDKTTWIWFRLRGDNAIEGVGEATLNNRANELLAALPGAMEQLAAGTNLGLAGKLHRVRRQIAGPVGRAITSAIEQSWLDLEGKRTGRPLHDMLGGRYRSEIPCYANINRGTLSRTPDEFAERAAAAIADGFPAVKMAPFDNVTPDPQDEAQRDRWIEAGLQRVRAVTQRLGDRGRVQVDCHSRLRPEEAAGVLERLADCGIAWFEEPIRETEAALGPLGALRAVAQQRVVVLAGAEQAAGLAEFEPYCHSRCYDIIMPDIILAGGPSEVVRIGHLAAAVGQAVSLHNPSGPVMDMHSAHAAAAVPELYSLERQVRESPLYDELVTRQHAFAGGSYRMGNVPGLGLAVDWAASHVVRQFGADLLL